MDLDNKNFKDQFIAVDILLLAMVKGGLKDIFAKVGVTADRLASAIKRGGGSCPENEILQKTKLRF